jgi:hypothetical protein
MSQMTSKILSNLRPRLQMKVDQKPTLLAAEAELAAATGIAAVDEDVVATIVIVTRTSR